MDKMRDGAGPVNDSTPCGRVAAAVHERKLARALLARGRYLCVTERDQRYGVQQELAERARLDFEAAASAARLLAESAGRLASSLEEQAARWRARELCAILLGALEGKAVERAAADLLHARRQWRRSHLEVTRWTVRPEHGEECSRDEAEA